MVAILGPSGAGKTTLLNILAGRIDHSGHLAGTILLNGQRRSRRTWKRTIGYVTQQDIMHRTLTVKENVSFADALRHPAGVTDKAEATARVKRVLDKLGLSECADSIIGDEMTRGISGGELKRVSIAMELVTDPNLLFLDEPTSGLDAFTALNVVDQCKKLALEDNKTVLMTIHQPRSDILFKFDKIILLAQGGRCVYFGPTEAALEYFRNLGHPCPNLVNPADFFLDIISIDDRSDELKQQSQKRLEEFADKWSALHDDKAGYLVAQLSADTLLEKKQLDMGWNKSWFTELGILLGREFKCLFRNKIYLGATIVQTIFISVILGLTYFQIPLDQNSVQTRIGTLFFISTNLIFSIVQPIILIWPLEKMILLRERASHSYRVSSAFLAKSISILPLRMTASFIFGTILYLLLGFQLSAIKYGIFIAIIITFSFCAQSLGLFLGSVSPNVHMSQILAPMLIVIFLMYGGNIGNDSSIPIALSWIQYISPLKYAYAALFQNEFSGLVFNPTEGNHTFQTGEQVIHLYQVDFLPMYACFVILFSLACLFQILAYIALARSTKSKLNLSI